MNKYVKKLQHFLSDDSVYLDRLFILLILVYFVLGQLLLWNIPYSYPFGGPDELMHLSMADYIATHLSWPRWDSTEVVRNAYGVSYSAGGSIVYWLHGLSYKLFGFHRLGSFLLLTLYLFLTTILYKKNRLSGFLLLAGLFPQTLFILSYVNSDVGTILTALLFGMSVGAFVSGKDDIKGFLMLFFFAGLAVTARQHLWAIAFITLVWTVVYKRHTIYQYDKKIWLWGIFIALLPASWWFITSFIANDGDILGVFTNAKSIASFGNPDLPLLSRSWEDISLGTFLYSTLTSLYANWGWTSLPLSEYAYILTALIAFSIVSVVFQKINKKIFIFFSMLVFANLGFMILYSVAYDYQAQGRYLFPSIYIVLGAIATILMYQKVSSKMLLLLFIVFSLQNLYFSTYQTLFRYIEPFIEKPVLLTTMKPTNHYAHASFYIDSLKVVEDKLFIAGWAFDNKVAKPFKNLDLLLNKDNRYYKVALHTKIRPDLVTAFKNKALDKAGFTATYISLKNLEKTNYKLLLFMEVDNQMQYVDINQSLKR